MGAGFLNILSESDGNIILVGNPSKTFFKKTILSHTNFGKQKFRIDFEGNTRLNYTTPTLYNFKIPRYGDLLQETFFSFTLPNIWSPLIAFGGTPVVFCSECRTNIKTNLDYLSINKNNTYSFNTKKSITKCGLCDCSCNSPSEVSNDTLEFLQATSNINIINRVYPLEFKWIENIGVQVINSIRVLCNNSIIQEFSGQYLLNMVYRDFSDNQKKIFNKMIGNVPELNNPAYYSNRNGNYPNAAYFGSLSAMSSGLEPSIRGRQLLVPINLWSTLNNKTPLPLVAMQYTEVRIEIELKPVNEWWVVKNVINEVSININESLTSSSISSSISSETGSNELNNLVGILHNTYSAPNCNNEVYNLKVFLKEPPRKVIINKQSDLLGATLSETGALVYPLNSNKLIENYYKDVPSPWFADIHLICCYTFLTNEEQLFFSQNNHSYLIKEVHEYTFNDLIGGSHFTEIKTSGLVVSWMWFFQRSDVKYRNEWSNYSNYNYRSNSEIMTLYGLTDLVSFNSENLNRTNKLDSIIWQKKFTAKENKDILLEWGLYFNNSIREITLEKELVSYIDIYSRSQGCGLDNVFYYNFCLNSDPLIYQPSGATNMSKINNIYMSYKLIDPLLKTSIKNASNYISNIKDPFLYASVIGSYLSNTLNSNVTCSTTNNDELTTINLKDTEKYVWNYKLHLMEERYNILKIINGVANLQLARSL